MGRLLVRRFCDQLFEGFAALFFMSGVVPGLVVVGLCLGSPVPTFLGILTVVVAFVSALICGQTSRFFVDSAFIFNPLLVGFLCGGLGWTGMAFGVASVAGVVVFGVTWGLSVLLSETGLPILSFPFVIVGSGLVFLGGSWFVPSPVQVVLLLVVLGWYSWRLLVLAVVGFVLGWGINGALVAMALGGVFQSFSLKNLGMALGAVVVAVGIERGMVWGGLPVLTWPFNIVTLGFLYGAAQLSRRAQTVPALILSPVLDRLTAFVPDSHLLFEVFKAGVRVETLTISIGFVRKRGFCFECQGSRLFFEKRKSRFYCGRLMGRNPYLKMLRGGLSSLPLSYESESWTQTEGWGWYKLTRRYRFLSQTEIEGEIETGFSKKIDPVYLRLDPYLQLKVLRMGNVELRRVLG